MYNTGNRGFAAAVITGGLIGVSGTAAALRPVPPFVPVSAEPKPDGRDRGSDLGGFSGDFPRTPPAGPLNQASLGQSPLGQAPPAQSPLNGHARPAQPGSSMQFGQQPGQPRGGQPPLNQQSGGHRQPFPPPAQPLGPQAGPMDGFPRSGGSLDALNAPSRPAQDSGFGDSLGSGGFNPVSSSGPIGAPGSVSAADSEGTVGLRVVSEPTGQGRSDLGRSDLGQPNLGSAQLEQTRLEPAGLDPLNAAATSTGGRRAAPEPEQSSSLGEPGGYRGVEEIIGSIGQRPVQDGPRGGGRRRRPDNEQGSGLRVVPEMSRQSATEYRPGLTGEMTGTDGYQLVAEMTGTGGYQAVPDVLGSGGYRAEPEPVGTHGGFQVGSAPDSSGPLRAVSTFGDASGGRHGAPSFDAPARDADALAFGANINPTSAAPRTDPLGAPQQAVNQPATFGAQQHSAGSDGFLAGNVAALAAPTGPSDGPPIGALGPAEGSRGTGFYAYGEAAPEVELGAAARRATSGLYKDRSVESSLGTAAVASQQFASDRPEQPAQQRSEPMSVNRQNVGPRGGGQQVGRQQFAGEPVGGHRAQDTSAASTTALDSSALGSLDGTLYFRS
ncbi:hypothetical protein [Pseudonocardia spinosispora]|uniref:hypothetical protein n=1 Tax=Pseudonocardia spinosispora TaxID=103441 RepID=UPI0012EBC55C|nr:hypothetical protein [Pseudonocardia spinosispora]